MWILMPGWEGRQTRALVLVSDKNLWTQETERGLSAAEGQGARVLLSRPCTPLEPPARGHRVLGAPATLTPQSHLQAEADQRQMTILPDKMWVFSFSVRIRSSIV